MRLITLTSLALALLASSMPTPNAVTSGAAGGAIEVGTSVYPPARLRRSDDATYATAPAGEAGAFVAGTPQSQSGLSKTLGGLGETLGGLLGGKKSQGPSQQSSGLPKALGGLGEALNNLLGGDQTRAVSGSGSNA